MPLVGDQLAGCLARPGLRFGGGNSVNAPQYEAGVQTATGTFGVPGEAAALLHGGQIAYRRGLGAQKLVSEAPVTARSGFRIGATTNSMPRWSGCSI
jgi:CubicO group peptidase (beta-lactamase class C family)